MNNLMPSTIRAIVARVPAVVPYLKGRARWIVAKPAEFKTYDYFLQQVERMVTRVYNDQLGGEFIDIMANLISGQLTQAFRQAWQDEEMDGDLPGYLTGELERMILSEYEHVDQYYRDIVDARLDGTPITPLLVRAGMWANRYDDAYNRAVALITAENGGNMVWRRGATEQSCEICSRLNGIVARASEWDALNVRPQNPPNPILAKENGGCGGWQCDCSLEPTDKRRSPKAYNMIMNIVSR
jgi:hypothetical protein